MPTIGLALELVSLWQFTDNYKFITIFRSQEVKACWLHSHSWCTNTCFSWNELRDTVLYHTALGFFSLLLGFTHPDWQNPVLIFPFLVCFVEKCFCCETSSLTTLQVAFFFFPLSSEHIMLRDMSSVFYLLWVFEVVVKRPTT